MSETSALEAEFDASIEKAEVMIPEDRRTAILKGYAELKGMTKLLRTMEITPADEPANIYGFDPVLRGISR